MIVPLVVVDAFTDRPFAGNPAGVVMEAARLDDPAMQLIAREMNHAETAFLIGEGNDYRLRWFTPTTEVDLCGHATLAAAHALREQGKVDVAQPVRFETRSGLLSVTYHGDELIMDFPAEPVVEEALPLTLDFGAPILFSGRNRMDWFVEIGSEVSLRNWRPDLATITLMGLRGLIVTAAGREYDFVSRGFFPNAGVAEDFVTGSAHCALGPHWAAKLGKTKLRGYQASSRGGEVGVELRGERVLLLGKAVTTLRGDISLPGS